VEILDVSQMLLAAVKRGDATGNGHVPDAVDALGAGAPHTADTTPEGAAPEEERRTGP